MKVQNFQNPELEKFKTQNLHYAYNTTKNIKLTGQMSFNKLKINQRSHNNLPNSVIWGWLSMESQPQNPEFRINPENFHPISTAKPALFCNYLSEEIFSIQLFYKVSFNSPPPHPSTYAPPPHSWQLLSAFSSLCVLRNSKAPVTHSQFLIATIHHDSSQCDLRCQIQIKQKFQN